MSRLFHRALVLAISLALIASAAAWRDCKAFQALAAATVASTHHAHMADAHAAHDHGAMMHHHASADPDAAPAGTDRDCTMCWALAAAATLTPPIATGVAVFTASSAEFFGDPAHGTGTTVAVDPGIPKRIS
jgi:hypothetical protein